MSYYITLSWEAFEIVEMCTFLIPSSKREETYICFDWNAEKIVLVFFVFPLPKQ